MAKKDENEAVFGLASSDRSDNGRLVVVDHDTHQDGKLYKAGTHDLSVGVADALIADERAHEPGGKGKGRDEVVDNG